MRLFLRRLCRLRVGSNLTQGSLLRDAASSHGSAPNVRTTTVLPWWTRIEIGDATQRILRRFMSDECVNWHINNTKENDWSCPRQTRFVSCPFHNMNAIAFLWWGGGGILTTWLGQRIFKKHRHPEVRNLQCVIYASWESYSPPNSHLNRIMSRDVEKSCSKTLTPCLR